MPAELRSPRIEHELFIRSFFSLNPPARVATQLASAMRDLPVQAGSMLYERGQPAEYIYFIVRGRVVLEAPNAPPWEFGNNSLIGILDAGTGLAYSRTARALENTQAIALNYADYLDVLEDNFEFAKTFLQVGASLTNDSALELAPDGVFPADFGSQPSFVRSAEADAADPITRLLVLRATPLLSRAPVQALASLVRLATVRRWAAGDVLYELGTASEVMHVVVSGQASVRRHSPTVTATVGPNRVVGGLSAFGSSVHAYTAVANTAMLTLDIHKEDFFDVAEDHFGLGRAVFWAVGAERIRVNAERARRASEAPKPPGDT